MGIFSGREGSSEGVQKRDVNGENFRLGGKSWLFFVASDSRGKQSFPLSPLLKSNNNAPNQRTGLIVINGRPPRFPKKIHDNAIFISESGYIKGSLLSLSFFRDLLKFNTMESEFKLVEDKKYYFTSFESQKF